MSTTPLTGRRIVLTRAGHQNSELHAKLAAGTTGKRLHMH